MRSFLFAIVCFLGIMQSASAQTPYNYSLEGFDDAVFPTTAPTVETQYTSATGTWALFKANTTASTDPCPVNGTNRALRMSSGNNAYVVTPTLPQGVGTITFNDGRNTRTFTYYTSTNDGGTWSAGTTVATGPACNTVTIVLNSGVINKVKIANLQGQDAGLDNLLLTSFTTNPPTVTTTAVTGITLNSANSGGNVTADGGAPVTARGVCWSTLANPTIADATTSNGTGLGAFTSAMTGLTPGTTYHVRAYATNAVGTGYGADISFTTPPPTPTLIVNPTSLAFGTIFQNTISPQQTFTVSGIYLTPAAGNITVTAPAGYQVSLTSGTGFGNSVTIPYTGNTLAATTIYVVFYPPTNGTYNGNITNAGGGAPNVNVAVTGIGSALPVSGNLTNLGLDFWTGYGYHARMKDNDNSNGAWMSLYISAKNAAVVKISMPGIADPTFPKTINIPANTSVEVTNFPMGDFNNNNNNPTLLPDARLYFTGITPRGIHIESLNGEPVAVFEHTYGKDAAGAMMVFPTNTWGATYNVLSLGGKSNSGIPNSFFFVMAKEDGTQIQITPTADIVDSSNATVFKDNTPVANIKYPINVPFTITLNKGQVFNAMSRVVGSGSSGVGQDLTGSLIKSVDCNKKIAVFAGNGRTFVNTTGCSVSSGSDNMLQQMFPRVAWGTKYLTTPTKTMEFSVYKICVQDPTTKVWVNNPSHTTPLTGIINNFYYQIENNQFNLIEADKPIMVIQYIITGGCKAVADGNNGQGDPEMIILSPVQQAINSSSVFSASKLAIISNGGASYINVVIKTAGVASFKLDAATNPTNVCDTGTSSFSASGVYGSSATIPVASAFRVHPNEPGYSYARFKVASGQYHNIQSDSGFNAIAYGLAQGESYGYSAGTAIKDLSAIIATHNPYDSITGSKTCRGNPSQMEIALPYPAAQVTQIIWDAGTNPNVTPNGIFTDNSPTPVRTYTTNDITYNVYKMPATLTFTQTGIYRIFATVNGTFSSECGSTQIVPIDMEVVSDSAKFNFVPLGCGSTTVTFTDQSNTHLGGSIKQWLWNFGDATTSIVQNPPPHVYPAVAVYNAKLRIVNEIGCYTDTTRVIDLTGGLTAKFSVSPNDTVCSGTNVHFVDLSTSTGINGPITKWHWSFGEGSPVISINGDTTHTYNTPGIFWAKLYVETGGGCLSAIDSIKIVVNGTPVSDFTYPASICNGDLVQFNDISTVVPGAVTEWYWDFGDPASGAANTSNLKNPTHTFSGTGLFSVTLYVGANGCISPTKQHDIYVNALPVANFTFTSPACAGQAVTFNSTTSTAVDGTINSWTWDFGDPASGPNNTSILQNPTHNFSAGGTYTVKLTVKTDRTCSSVQYSTTVTVRATPVANFTLPGNLCLPNASATFTNTTTISDGTLPTVTYVWDFGDLTPTSNATNPTHIYTGTGPYTVTLTATSAQGCGNSISKQLITIYAQPIAGFTAVPEACAGSTISFTNTSTAPGSTVTQWFWDFGDPGSGANNTSNATNPTHIFSGTGPYTVKLYVRSATGCQSADFTQNITINQLPTANYNVQPIRCAGNTIAFTDASAPNSGVLSSWSWTFGDPLSGPLNTSNAQNPTHVYTTAGTYTVTLTVTNSKTCVSTLYSNTVTINPKPVSDFTVPNICIPTGAGTFTATSSISSGSIVGYAWNFGDLSAPGSGTPVSHTYAAGGNYQVTLTTTSAAGCTKDSIKTVGVYNTPVAGYSIAPGAICSNVPLSISNTSAVTGFGSVNKIEVYWDHVNDLTNKTVDNTPTTGGTYTHQYPVFGSPATKTYRVLIMAYSGSGCVDQYFTDVVVNAAPVAVLANLSPVCQEVTPFILTQGSETTGMPGTGVYSGPGITLSPMFSPAAAGPGIYTIRYTYSGNNGCSSFAEKQIEVYPTPQINAGPDLKVLEGDAVTLQPTLASNNLTYLWLPSTYLDNPTKANPISKPTNDITYTVTVRSQDGCVASDDLFIKVVRDFVVPNTFTPNNDGINDFWMIDNLSLYPVHRVQVFNRYGQLIYETKDYTKAWDGTYKGKPLPLGTYYYIIELGGQRKPKTGYVTIIK